MTFIFPVPVIGESVRKRKSSVNLMKKWDAVIVKNTIFTRMQNNPDIEMTTLNATSARKKYSAINFIHIIHKVGTAVVQWLRCCATNRKVAGSIPACVNEFFIDIKSFRSYYGPGVNSASNRNEYQEYFWGVKMAGA